jgi:hypothetical protein
MVFVTSNRQAWQRRRWWDGTYMSMEGSHVRDYFGREIAGGIADQPPDRAVRCPHAFFVEQGPNTVLPAHFHMVDQFQVLFGGGGKIGREAMDGFGVHYTNAYTPYGPIQAGPSGFHYFTLRNAFDNSGAHRMPESVRRLPRAPRRHHAWHPAPPCDPAVLAAGTELLCETLHAEEPDGLGAWVHCLPPEASLRGPDPARGAGQYWIVIAGGLLRDGALLDPLSCLFVTEDELPLDVTAGPRGLEILAMQFPKTVPRQQ